MPDELPEHPELPPPGRYGRNGRNGRYVILPPGISINAKPEEATAPLIDWTKVRVRKPLEIGVTVSINMTELEMSLPILSLDDITQRPKNDEIER